MSHRFSLLAILCIAFSLADNSANAQKINNWTPQQLMSPAVLAKDIQDNQKLPMIVSVGPMALIPGSVDIGMISDEGVSATFKTTMSDIPRDSSIVVYCGCCPFERCPNIRPAIEILKELKFTNFRLLNLPTSIKADWIDKHYPVIE